MSYLHRSKSLPSLEFSFHDYPKHSECASYFSKVIGYQGHDNIAPNGENRLNDNDEDSEVFIFNKHENMDDPNDESDPSGEVYIVNEQEMDMNDHSDDTDKNDRGDEVIAALENKLDRLNDLYEEQCGLLADLKDAKKVELLLKALELNSSQFIDDDVSSPNEGEDVRARRLLDALKIKSSFNLDREIAQALVDFLHDEDLKERVVKACVESVRDMVQRTLCQDLSRIYQSAVQRLHSNLIRQHACMMERAFIELGRRVAVMAFRNCRSLLPTLRWHFIRPDQTPKLRIVAKLVLEKELQQWRKKALEIVTTPLKSENPMKKPYESAMDSPRKPLQPAEPKRSIIDQLMMKAEIDQKIQEGDINGAFEKALSACDLSLVMGACRAVDPAGVFTPTCHLQPHVLLSLLQQLATDMLHDTQLKCRYLEEAVLELKKSSAATRVYLPLVIRDVRKHLASFLENYPSHDASRRRVALIFIACENLLK